jgi:hypothetical protein
MTAEEFLEQQGCIRNVEDFFNDVQPIDLIEFAKYHVGEALKKAVENMVDGCVTEEDEERILNCYPLTNIE